MACQERILGNLRMTGDWENKSPPYDAGLPPGNSVCWCIYVRFFTDTNHLSKLHNTLLSAKFIYSRHQEDTHRRWLCLYVSENSPAFWYFFLGWHELDHVEPPDDVVPDHRVFRFLNSQQSQLQHCTCALRITGNTWLYLRVHSLCIDAITWVYLHVWYM